MKTLLALLLVVALVLPAFASNEKEKERVKESGEVLTDDLRGFVAFDALSAGVPGADQAIGIEHEDRIVPHRVNEQMGPLFTAAQSQFSAPAFAKVACDFPEADQRRSRVPDRRNRYTGPEF